MKNTRMTQITFVAPAPKVEKRCGTRRTNKANTIAVETKKSQNSLPKLVTRSGVPQFWHLK
jgi:hypothetical protein